MSFSASQIFFRGRRVPVVDQKDTDLLQNILKAQDKTHLGNNQT